MTQHFILGGGRTLHNLTSHHMITRLICAANNCMLSSSKHIFRISIFYTWVATAVELSLVHIYIKTRILLSPSKLLTKIILRSPILGYLIRSVGIRMAATQQLQAKPITAAPEVSDTEELEVPFAGLQVKVPRREETALHTRISASKRYNHYVPHAFIDSQYVLMDKIISNLPHFIAEHVKLTPDARSMETTADIAESARDMYCIDCDYILTIHIPVKMKKYFKIEEEKKEVHGVRTRYNRWIFVPSYRREQRGLFDWSDTGADLEKTPRVIVVRPSEFKKYKKEIGKNPNLHVVLLSLPQEVNGIGYARLWIQRIADHFQLSWIWMIDDDVSWIRRYDLSTPPTQYCTFESVFEEIEKFAEDNDIAAVSPRVFSGPWLSQVTQPFTWKPPQGMVLLNLRNIRKMRVHYRPQLLCLEDMIFAYECQKAGLKVCMLNTFVFHTKRWKGSGVEGYKEGEEQLFCPACNEFFKSAGA